MTLGYRLDGPDGAPALALFGSLGSTTNIWEPQLAAFAARGRVIRFDHPGHGASPVPDRPVTVADIAASALAVLDELGIGRVAVCGLSLGGMVAMWLGANAAERVGRIVLACTGAKLGTLRRLERASRARPPRGDGGRRRRAFASAGSRRRSATRRRRNPSSTSSSPSPPRATHGGARPSAHSTSRGELGRIGQPVLVVAGAEDPVTPPDVVDALVGGIPNAALATIPHAAHLANVEQPDAFTAAVLSHLDERAAA